MFSYTETTSSQWEPSSRYHSSPDNTHHAFAPSCQHRPGNFCACHLHQHSWNWPIPSTPDVQPSKEHEYYSHTPQTYNSCYQWQPAADGAPFLHSSPVAYSQHNHPYCCSVPSSVQNIPQFQQHPQNSLSKTLQSSAFYRQQPPVPVSPATDQRSTASSVTSETQTFATMSAAENGVSTLYSSPGTNFYSSSPVNLYGSSPTNFYAASPSNVYGSSPKTYDTSEAFTASIHVDTSQEDNRPSMMDSKPNLSSDFKPVNSAEETHEDSALYHRTQNTSDPVYLTSLANHRTDSHNKPPYSYITLIVAAMRSKPSRQVTLNDIYAWIMKNFAFYIKNIRRWQNSIRHALSFNDCFVKVPRPTGEAGKGSYWTIHPDAVDMFDNGSTMRRNRKFIDTGKELARRTRRKQSSDFNNTQTEAAEQPDKLLQPKMSPNLSPVSNDGAESYQASYDNTTQPKYESSIDLNQKSFSYNQNFRYHSNSLSESQQSTHASSPSPQLDDLVSSQAGLEGDMLSSGVAQDYSNYWVSQEHLINNIRQSHLYKSHWSQANSVYS